MEPPKHPTHDDHAAPPDAGGHYGSDTRPDEVLVVGDADSYDEPPALSRDVPSPPERSFNWATVLAVVVVLAMLAAPLYYLRGC